MNTLGRLLIGAIKSNMLTFVIKLLVGSTTRLQHDPKSQYAFNRFFALFWLGVGILAACYRTMYADQLPVLILEEGAIWSCFATHISGMSQALASMQKRSTPGTPPPWRY